jgi:hypothetical protein
MSHRIQCAEHGDSISTVVCVHICDTLKDGKPRGFLWSIDEDNDYQAVCADCRAMDRRNWRRMAKDLGRVLCFECYSRAGELNGIVLPRSGTEAAQ